MAVKQYKFDLRRTNNLVALRVTCLNPPQQNKKGMISIIARGETGGGQRSFGILIKSFPDGPEIEHIKPNDRFLAIGSLDVYSNWKTGKRAVSLNLIEIYDIEYEKLQKVKGKIDDEDSKTSSE